MTKSKFEIYKSIKSRISFSHKSLAMSNIIALDILTVVYKDVPSVRHLIYFFITHDLKNHIPGQSQKFFTMINLDRRADYYQIWDYVLKQKKDVHKADCNNFNKRFHFSPGSCIKAVFEILKATKGTPLSLYKKIYLMSRFAFYCNVIDTLEKIQPTVKDKYVAFSGVHPLEAILTLYFKKKNTPTYTLQHGLYYIFRKEIPLDALPYENFISDYHLCWGQYTKDEFEAYGIPSSSLLVAGYPREVERGKILSDNPIKNCTVLMARVAYDQSNQNLLSILASVKDKLQINVNLKLHPSLNFEEYKNICQKFGFKLIEQSMTIRETFTGTDAHFCIAVNTSAYYESYIYNRPCLRYCDEVIDNSIEIEEDDFYTEEQLTTAIQKYRNVKDWGSFFRHADKRLQYVIGLNINQYKDIL